MKILYMAMGLVSLVCVAGKIAENDMQGMREYITHSLLWLVLLYQESK